MVLIALCILLALVTGCSTDAEKASYNPDIDYVGGDR